MKLVDLNSSCHVKVAGGAFFIFICLTETLPDTDKIEIRKK